MIPLNLTLKLNSLLESSIYVTTLRTLICSCQYLHEGGPRAALGLTHHVCTIPHTILPFQWGHRGSVAVSRWGVGRTGEGGREGGRNSEERKARSCCVLRDEFPVTADDRYWRRSYISDLVPLFGGRKGMGHQGQPSDRDAGQLDMDQPSFNPHTCF